MALWEPSAMTIQSSHSASAQGSFSFKRKLKWKLVILDYAVQQGYQTFYMDSDIVLFKDPIPYFNSLPQYDLLAQRDTNVCTGFMFIRPTPNGKRLMKLAAYLGSLPYADDQESLNLALRYVHARTLLLPESLFPSGCIFFQHYQYSWDIHSGRGGQG